MTAYSVESGESANWTLHAAFDAEGPDDRERRAPQALVDGVGERLDRGDDDRVAGVDAERVDVLHRADGDARVVRVAHDLVLDLLPADQAALHHDLPDRARPQPGPDPLAVGRLCLDDPTTGATQRERRADDGRQADLRERLVGRGVSLDVGRALDDRAGGVGLADPFEQVAEQLAVLGHPDRLERRAEQTDAEAVEDAGVGQLGREVERRLPTEPGEEPLGAFTLDHGRHRGDGQRLEVDRVRDLPVGHDRRRVGVDENRPDALGTEGAAGLGPGVVELRGLADHDGPRAEDQDRGGLRGRIGHGVQPPSVFREGLPGVIRGPSRVCGGVAGPCPRTSWTPNRPATTLERLPGRPMVGS